MHSKAQQRIEQEHRPSSYPEAAHDPALDSPLFAIEEPPLPGQPRLRDRAAEAEAEAVLVDRARLGDRDAFSSLISDHLKTLYRLALRITRHHEDAEDAVQDAILKAHANLHQFEGRARFSTWIGRIAINEALMKRRKHSTRKHVPLEELTQADELIVRIPELERRADNPEALYARMEVREMLLQAASSLLPIYQAVFFLARVRGCTNQETAAELELPVATVRARLHRACKQMREKLTPMSRALPC